MRTQSLTAAYRPQRFAEVVGQHAVKAALSRAAATGNVAPAYLFSGTRGVGKTTLARILAKALNCEQAPTSEPCNVCRSCKAVMAGAAVDVIEIDAASNRGIEDAKRLKEDIGYAPMEGRFRVFIIDEAHMLTREAFNALLKTLEEPPAHATFVLATTEPHKFPATIISRCQHYTFKRLAQAELEAHLTDVLAREGVQADPGAVALIARRGAGSVRDAMSLLAQVLAMGAEQIGLDDVREVLGLAGFEVIAQVIEAAAASDTAALVGAVRTLLDQGLDLGFFLRELAGAFRNMFLAATAPQAAAGLMDVPAEEAERLAGLARTMGAARIHAGWQLILESQRGVLTSLEPGLALELLLLNLAHLPRLMSLASIEPVAQPAAAGTAAPAPAAGPATQAAPATSGAAGTSGTSAKPRGAARPAAKAGPESEVPPDPEPEPEPEPDPEPEPIPAAELDLESESEPEPEPEPEAQATPATPAPPATWEGFLARAQERNGLAPALVGCSGRLEDDTLHLTCRAHTQAERLAFLCGELEALAGEVFAAPVRVQVHAPASTGRSYQELHAAVREDERVAQLMETFGARIVSVKARKGGPERADTDSQPGRED